MVVYYKEMKTQNNQEKKTTKRPCKTHLLRLPQNTIIHSFAF